MPDESGALSSAVQPPKLVLRGVGKQFAGRHAVRDVSLEVAEGEFVVILGPSGCGKTTTLRMVAGLERPDEGVVTIGGRVASDAGTFLRPEHRAIGMVFQSYAIWPHMTVGENVGYPLRVRGVRGAARKARVEAALDLVGLHGAGGRAATALSGGQMQRVALARALVSDPSLLLFDEPLSNLDLKLRERLRVELKALQRRTGLTSLYVTHDQGEAVELADRIVVMQDGAIVQVGAPHDLYRAPRTRFVAEFIATANILPGTVVNAAPGHQATVRLPSGFQLLAQHGLPGIAPGQVVDVVVHPEDCTLSAGGEGEAVVVEDARFQGTATRYTVRLGPNRWDVLVLGTAAPLPPGSEARLLVAPGRARLV